MAFLGDKNTMTIKEAREILFDLKRELELVKGYSKVNTFTDREYLTNVIPLLSDLEQTEAVACIKSNSELIEELIKKVEQITTNAYFTDKEKEELYLDVRKKYEGVFSDKAKLFNKLFKASSSEALKRVRSAINCLESIYDNTALGVLISVSNTLRYIDNDFKNKENNISFNGRLTPVGDVLDKLIPFVPELSARDREYYNARFGYTAKYSEAIETYLKDKGLPASSRYIDREAEERGENSTQRKASIVEKWLEDEQEKQIKLNYAQERINEIASGNNFETLEEYKKRFKEKLLGE